MNGIMLLCYLKEFRKWAIKFWIFFNNFNLLFVSFCILFESLGFRLFDSDILLLEMFCDKEKLKKNVLMFKENLSEVSGIFII